MRSFHFHVEHSGINLDSSIQKAAKSGLNALIQRNDLGFLKLPQDTKRMTEVKDRVDELRSLNQSLVVVGMGGSALGGRALVDALGSRKDREVYFWDSLDSEWLESQWRVIESQLHQTHFVFVSKSGTTMETLALHAAIKNRLSQKGYQLEAQSTVITEERSNTLHEWADQNEIPYLTIPFDVGGRFSALSPVGLLPLVFAGGNMSEVMQGAKWAFQQHGLIEDWVGAVLKALSEQFRITVFWSYSERALSLGYWWQQLWSESLGKKLTRQGSEAPWVSTPLVCRGPADQHSLLQQFMEGQSDKWIWFFGEESSDYGQKWRIPSHQCLSEWGESIDEVHELLVIEREATYQSLCENGTPCTKVLIPSLTPYYCGAFMGLMESLVGALGEVFDIDAYNQPGVEAGKALTKEIMTKGHCQKAGK